MRVFARAQPHVYTYAPYARLCTRTNTHIHIHTHHTKCGVFAHAQPHVYPCAPIILSARLRTHAHRHAHVSMCVCILKHSRTTAYTPSVYVGCLRIGAKLYAQAAKCTCSAHAHTRPSACTGVNFSHQSQRAHNWNNSLYAALLALFAPRVHRTSTKITPLFVHVINIILRGCSKRRDFVVEALQNMPGVEALPHEFIKRVQKLAPLSTNTLIMHFYTDGANDVDALQYMPGVGCSTRSYSIFHLE